MLAAARDVMIVLVALETLVIGVLLIILILQIRSLIRLVQGEIRPILTSVNETASTIKATTSFVSHNVASPVIRAASMAAGAGQVLRTLRGGRDSSKGKRT